MSGQEVPLTDSDFTGNNLIEDEFVNVATVESTAKYQYAGGSDDYREGVGNIYADFEDSGTNDVNGELRFVVYESDRLDDVKVHNGNRVRGKRISLSKLRATTQSDIQTWLEYPQMSVGAGEDEVVAVQVKVDNSTNDGNSINLSNSTYDIPLTEREV